MPFMHIAVLVEDLHESIEDFSSKLGASFTSPATTELDNFHQEGERRSLSVVCAYSRTGPPYYELIQAHESGIFGRESLGFHHIGLWGDGSTSQLDTLTARGFEPEGIQYTPDGHILIAYFKPSGLNGLRMELINEVGREMLEAWAAGTDFIPEG